MPDKLQWEQTSPQTWRADTPHGRYVWWEFGDGDQYLQLPGDYAGRKVLDAKARAQADFEVRARSALEANHGRS